MGLEYSFKNVKAKLNQLEKKASKEVIDRAVNAGADVAVEIIKDYVYDNVRDTGELHDSIDKGKTKGKDYDRYVDVGIMTNDRKVIERGYYQHYGKRREIGNRWLDVSFEISKEEAKKAMKESLKKDLKL